MVKDDIAGAVLAALGGRENVLTNTVCMTRLRVALKRPQDVNYEELNEVQGVLGTATRGNNGLEVVFGPAMIDGIYHAFLKLTGIAAGTDALFPMSRQESSIRVKISPARSTAPVAKRAPDASSLDEHDLNVLESLFGRREEEPVATDGRGDARLLVVNGPNVNMLGSDASESGESYPALLELCKQAAQGTGFTRCDCYQSNHEGDLVDAIQDAHEAYAGIVINPSTYGNSKTLYFALEVVGVPAIAVHLHKRQKRDTVAMACIKMISGHGIAGYREAIAELAAHIGLADA